jgi:hypothetical protein
MMCHTIRLIVIFALAILAAPLASDVKPARPWIGGSVGSAAAPLPLGLIPVRKLIEEGLGIPATPQA